jgi:hypothetical protein
MKRIVMAAIVLLITCAASPVHAQQGKMPSFLRTVQELLLNDGSRLYGVVESETSSEVVFRTTSGAQVTAPREKIVSIRPVVGRMLNGEFRREDPNSTRLLFGPTGRTLRKGEVYLGVYEFLMPFVQVGITDRISIGGGTPLFFGSGESYRPFWITPKVQVYSGKGTHVSAGLFHAAIDDDNVGVAYGVVTKEVATGSFTVGAGVGYNSEGGRGGVVMAGAEAPLRRNMKLITENYLWRSTGIASIGVRFFGENLSADLALGAVLVSDGVFAAPIVNFVYRF